MSSWIFPHIPFPTERLIVSEATMGGSAHRNADNPLHIDWDFFIKFKPLELAGETYETAMHVEIETRDVRRIEQFAGMERHDTDPDFNIGSFYLDDHHRSQDTRFKIHSVRGNNLDIEVSLMVYVRDYYVEPNTSPWPVRLRTEVMFDGILVSSYSVQCQADEKELIKIASELFDTSSFAAPKELPDPYPKKDLNLFFVPLERVF